MNIAEMDKRGVMEKCDSNVQLGFSDKTWSPLYNMDVKEVRASGQENYEAGQETYTAVKAWMARKFDRKIDTTMRFFFQGVYYYIDEVHDHPQNRGMIIFEGYARNNQND